MITSTSNKQVKFIQQLQKKARVRREERLFVAEGPRMVAETPAQLVQSVYVSESFEEKWKKLFEAEAFGEYEVVTDAVMRAMSETETPQGVLAVVRWPEYELKEMLGTPGQKLNLHLIFLEGVQDPGNLGTILRTGEGAGITGVVMDPQTVDVFNPKVVRATMGSLYRVPFVLCQSKEEWDGAIAAVQEAGVMLYAAHLKGTKNYDEFDFTGGTGFFIGNEGNGLTEETAKRADELLRIPMEGQVESLNAAMAAGILMYEVSRQRRG